MTLVRKCLAIQALAMEALEERATKAFDERAMKSLHERAMKALIERAELERFRSFVQGEVPGESTALVASVHCRIHPVLRTLWAELDKLTVSLTRRRRIVDTVVPSIEPSIELSFRDKDIALQVFQMLVACPTLTELNLHFSFASVVSNLFRPPCPDHGLVMRVFCLVRRSRSISTLGITFSSVAMFDRKSWGCLATAKSYGKRFFHKDLPIVLRDNPCIYNLKLEALEVVDESHKYRNAARGYPLTMTYCFSRIPASPKLWALSMSRSEEDKFHHEFYPFEEIVTLFPTVEQGEGSNVVLKVITYDIHSRVLCRDCQYALVDLVAHNTTLEKLNVGAGNYFFPSAALVTALGCNRSLKEFGPYLCTTLEEFQAFVRVFIPEASGRQAYTSLSTLKLRLPKVSQVLNSFEVLLRGNPLLHSVTTLKRFELVYGLDIDHAVAWRYTLLENSSSQDENVLSNAAGCQHNTSLSMLKLSLPKMESRKYLNPVVLECMTVLTTLLRMNILKHVELSQESYWPDPWRSDFLFNSAHARDERDLQSAIRTRLEQMMKNELRQNTCLQSLRVGWWRLIRVGTEDQWEIRYTGPCLCSPVQREEYFVKVRLR